MSRSKPSHRPGSTAAPASGSIAPIVLGGAVVLLLGIGLMAFLRMRQVGGNDPSEVTANDPSVSDGDAVIIPGDDADQAVVIPEDRLNNEAANVRPVSHSDDSATSDSATVAGVVDEIDTTRGRRLMAEMKSVATRVQGFAADSRGAVKDTVLESVIAELDRCRIPHRSGEQKPVMDVRLDLKRKDGEAVLWMSADLLASDDGQTVLVWKRSGNVASLNNQALTSGLMPPNLNRDIGLFFRSLRSDFVDARREFGP